MKKKLIALLLCLMLVASVAIPGTLAVGLDTAESSSDFTVENSADDTPAPAETEAPVCACPDVEGVDKTAEDYVHVKGCDFYVPVCTCEATEEEKAAEDFVHAKGCDFYVPVCTCEATEEEKAAEGFVHSEGCDFYAAPVDPNAELYEQLMAAATAEEFLALTEGMSEEEANAFDASLSDEQLAALQEHIQSIAPKEEHEPPQTVVFTDAGPFMPAVTVETSRRMRYALRSSGVETDNGLKLSKEATANNDGTYTIRMEAYTTGKVITTTKMVPVDIVLVLDQSGSMSYDFNGNETGDDTARRQYAMKQAVNNFIASVSDKYSEEADHRMAIVTFGSSASTLQGWTYVNETGKTTLQDKISGLKEPTDATNVAAGMTQAETLMGSGYSYTGTNTQRQKVVIVFTDGVPTTDSDFDTEVATNAIASAKNLKDSGATVYTVGIFTGANPNELYGASGFDTNSDGTVGSKWIKDTWGLFPGTDFPEADRPAGNRFLNYLSSNCPEAASIGLKRDTSGWGIFHYKITYEIMINYSRTADNYYLTADDSTSLNNIFQKISNNIQSANIDLGSETVVKDTVSKYFDLPTNTSEIKLYTAAAKEDGTFDTEVSAPEEVGATVQDGTVSVTGFDFNKNFVSDKPKEDGTYGKKLIIEFVVKPKEGFIGGNDVPTNDWEKSGVYDQNGTEVEKFANAGTTPTVNVPITKPAFTVNNKTIYQGNSTPTAGLYTLPDTTGWQYDYVKVTAAGVEGETVSPADCTDYRINVTYAPKTNGSGSAGTANAMEGVSEEKTATVHVLQPTVTAAVNDVQKYYGESYTLGDDANGSVNVTWTDKNSHSGIPQAEGTAPYEAADLSLAYSSDGFSGAVPKRDFDVTVKVMKGGAEVTDAVITTSCGFGCTADETDGKYTVHVKTCQLTVTKAGGNEGEPYVFTIYKDGAVYTSLTIVGNSSKTIYELPVGTYRIAEDTGWSWRFGSTAYTGEVTLSSAADQGTAGCTNSQQDTRWLNDYSDVVLNIFGIANTKEAA